MLYLEHVVEIAEGVFQVLWGDEWFLFLALSHELLNGDPSLPIGSGWSLFRVGGNKELLWCSCAG